MCKKLDKLKEVKALVNERIKKLETQLFLENSNGYESTIKESHFRTVAETKS